MPTQAQRNVTKDELEAMLDAGHTVGDILGMLVFFRDNAKIYARTRAVAISKQAAQAGNSAIARAFLLALINGIPE